MTKQEARLWLPVVEWLRKYYEGKVDHWDEERRSNCPLCRESGDNCAKCLWHLFEGEDCPSGAVQGRHNRPESWTKPSIIRLKGWETRLKGIIKGRN